MISDNPARTGDVASGPLTADFNDLPLAQKLDIIREKAARWIRYRMAAGEAIPMSEEYEAWVQRLIDSSITDAEFGRLTREMVCAYVAEVAAVHMKSLP